MNNRKSGDNLEALFGNRFNDIEEVSKMENWNQPSDAVWGKIHAELHPKKNRNRLVVFLPWMAVAASSLLLIGCFQLYQYHPTIHQLSYQITDKEKVKEVVQSSVEKAYNQEKKREDIAIRTPVMNDTHPEKKDDKKMQSTSPRVTQPLGCPVPKPLGFAFNKKSLKALEPDRINPVLPISQPLVHANNPITPTLKKKPSFYLAANYTPFWEESITSPVNIEVRDNHLSNSEHTTKTFSGGLALGVQLNKGWIVESGLSYRHATTTATYSGSIPHQKIEITQNNQGQEEHVTTLQVGSSIGNITTDLLLSKNSFPATENETDLNLDMSLSQSVKALDIPLLVKKRWAIGNLGLSIKAGILNRFILQQQLATPEVLLKDQAYTLQSTIIKEVPEVQKTTTYSGHVVAGVGIDYALLPKLSLFVEPTFTRSLQPSKNLELANLYTQGKMVDVGVRYDFGQ